MSNTTAKKNVSPADVVEKAVDDKLVVPAQAEGEKKVMEPSDVQKGDEEQDGPQSEPKLTVIEGGKRTFKNKLSAAKEKVAQRKKALLVTVGVVGTITLIAVKYAKSKAEEILDEDVQPELTEEDLAPVPEA